MLVTITAALALAAALPSFPPANPKAVREVEAGSRTVANAAWWGFDPVNSTAALQGAINSGATKVIVPNVGAEWIVDPLFLVSDQEIVFERGVVIAARQGGFPGLGDSLLTADKQRNLTIRGYGATLRMQKPEYTQGEWRMCINLGSCTNVRIYGLTLRDSGGDGIYLGNTDSNQPYCREIEVRDCVLDNHRRQGMSVISAQDLMVENCVFRNTDGTAPQAGVDLEPNLPAERLVNCVFRNCVMEDNTGPGILVYLFNLTSESKPVSVRFEDCAITSRQGSGIQLAGTRPGSQRGQVVFEDCAVEGCQDIGLALSSWAGYGVAARFRDCVWRDVALDGSDLPLLLLDWDREVERVVGGAEFSRCVVEDSLDRPALGVHANVAPRTVGDLHGDLTIRNPHGGRIDLGLATRDVTLRLRRETPRSR